MDKEGLYLTNLLDWQTDISLAQFEASVVGIPNMFNLGIAERGIADNFVVQVQCGKVDVMAYGTTHFVIKIKRLFVAQNVHHLMLLILTISITWKRLMH